MPTHILHPKRLQVVHCRAKTDGIRYVRCASLEAHRKVIPSRIFIGHRKHHLPASQERRHPLQHIQLDIQSTYARGSQHLMPRKREEVTVYVLHINRHVRNALRSVN